MIPVENDCPDGTFVMEPYCVNFCPPGYGASLGEKTCSPCEFYSYQGVCTKSCPGFAFGKQCQDGEIITGYVEIDNIIVKNLKKCRFYLLILV